MDNFGSNFQNFDIQQAMKLAQSDAAQQLLAMLQNADDPKLKSAMDQAAAGNLNPAKEILSQLMANEQTRDLLSRIIGDANG